VQHADIDSAAAAIILERWLLGEGRMDDHRR
jgi:RNase H-fold protein (predicted Holliday junction resolvase)